MNKLYTVKVKGIQNTWPVKFMNDLDSKSHWIADGLSVTEHKNDELVEYMDSIHGKKMYGVIVKGVHHTWGINSHMTDKEAADMRGDGISVDEVLASFDADESLVSIIQAGHFNKSVNRL